MVYLVGVNHAIQDNGFIRRIDKNKAGEIREEFRNYLVNVIAEKEITYIAEETCPEVLQKLQATSTMPKMAAESLNLPYIWVEPESEERNKLGIPACSYEHLPEEEKQKIYRIRENYWLKQIENNKNHNILFVCGPEHIKPFTKLLQLNQWEVSVLEEYWGEKYINT